MSNDEENEIKQIAKTANKAMDLAAKAGSFIDSIVGGGIKELGDSFHDWATYYRFKNLISIQDMVYAIYKERKILNKHTKIPARLAIPLINEASIEDNEQLQKMWAQLIANSTDPNLSTNVHPAFIEVLKQLQPDEAIIIRELTKIKSYPVITQRSFSYNTNKHGGFPNNMLFKELISIFEKICSSFNLTSANQACTYLDNLRRLQILEFNYGDSISLRDNPLDYFNTERASQSISLSHNATEHLVLTKFGQQLIETCVN